MKSSWKVNVYPYNCIRKKYQSQIVLGRSYNSGGNNRKDKIILSRPKNFRFFKECVGKRFGFWNGSKFLFIYVNESMLGRQAGSFILTKRITSEIHRKHEVNKRKPFLKK